jgi:predicted Zn-dependent protease
MAHVLHRHVLAEMIQDTLLSGAWVVAFGDYSGLFVLDPRTVEHLLELRQSRETEAEADATGLELMQRARISPAGLAAFFERNQAGAVEGALAFLSNHPSTVDRTVMIRNVRVEDARPALSAEQLAALSAVCRGRPAAKSLGDLVR